VGGGGTLSAATGIAAVDKTNNSLTPVAYQPGRLPDRTNNSLAPVAPQPGRPPVRVKLRRINANHATPYPPDGESKVWWRRLKKAALATAAARLLRAYSVQVETLRRLRHGGDQYVRVEHVHVNDGGQAIVGNVKTAGSGAAGAPEHSAGEVIAPAPSGQRN